MASLWNDQGVKIPVTVLQVENCQVTANIWTVQCNHTIYHAVQVAVLDKPEWTMTKQMLGHFHKAGVPPKWFVKEFPVMPDALVPVGTTLSAIHFVLGQYVDVIANNIGKGFQGYMKQSQCSYASTFFLTIILSSPLTSFLPQLLISFISGFLSVNPLHPKNAKINIPALWLSKAYKLEFLGEDVFLGL
ncbi:50S ribosomal protein L3 [Leucoagaricus sp. SymC.cos]|nr:50S ribosomal protein L3 [Leucoagaricus sp. SymC.cos]